MWLLYAQGRAENQLSTDKEAGENHVWHSRTDFDCGMLDIVKLIFLYVLQLIEVRYGGKVRIYKQIERTFFLHRGKYVGISMFIGYFDG